MNILANTGFKNCVLKLEENGFKVIQDAKQEELADYINAESIGLLVEVRQKLEKN